MQSYCLVTQHISTHDWFKVQVANSPIYPYAPSISVNIPSTSARTAVFLLLSGCPRSCLTTFSIAMVFAKMKQVLLVATPVFSPLYFACVFLEPPHEMCFSPCAIRMCLLEVWLQKRRKVQNCRSKKKGKGIT